VKVVDPREEEVKMAPDGSVRGRDWVMQLFEKGAPVAFFAEEMPPYVGGVSQDEEYVYDVDGIGTYLGRRESIRLYAEKKGKRLVPMCANGRTAVTWVGGRPGLGNGGIFEFTLESKQRVVTLESMPVITRIFVGSPPRAYRQVQVYSPDFENIGERRFPQGSIRRGYLESSVLYVPESVTRVFLATNVVAFYENQLSILRSLYGTQAGMQPPPVRPNIAPRERQDRLSDVMEVLRKLPKCSVYEGQATTAEIATAVMLSERQVLSLLRNYSGVLARQFGSVYRWTVLDCATDKWDTEQGPEAIKSVMGRYYATGEIVLRKSVKINTIRFLLFDNNVPPMEIIEEDVWYRLKRAKMPSYARKDTAPTVYAGEQQVIGEAIPLQPVKDPPTVKEQEMLEESLKAEY